MGGRKKKQTVGYRYRMGLHLALCQGPVDAVQEIQMGERTAWGNADRAPLVSGHRSALGHGLSAEHHRLEFLERGMGFVE